MCIWLSNVIDISRHTFSRGGGFQAFLESIERTWKNLLYTPHRIQWIHLSTQNYVFDSKSKATLASKLKVSWNFQFNPIENIATHPAPFEVEKKHVSGNTSLSINPCFRVDVKNKAKKCVIKRSSQLSEHALTVGTPNQTLCLKILLRLLPNTWPRSIWVWRCGLVFSILSLFCFLGSLNAVQHFFSYDVNDSFTMSYCEPMMNHMWSSDGKTIIYIIVRDDSIWLLSYHLYLYKSFEECFLPQNHNTEDEQNPKTSTYSLKKCLVQATVEAFFDTQYEQHLRRYQRHASEESKDKNVLYCLVWYYACYIVGRSLATDHLTKQVLKVALIVSRVGILCDVGIFCNTPKARVLQFM